MEMQTQQTSAEQSGRRQPQTHQPEVHRPTRGRQTHSYGPPTRATYAGAAQAPRGRGTRGPFRGRLLRGRREPDHHSRHYAHHEQPQYVPMRCDRC